MNCSTTSPRKSAGNVGIIVFLIIFAFIVLISAIVGGASRDIQAADDIEEGILG